MAKQKDPLINQTLGEYKIKKLIGKGGMSRVYQGEDLNLKRPVAIKIITLDPDRAKELMKRFEREGHIMAKLEKHPNIISVYRANSDDETRYLAMEFIDGLTLTDRMAEYKQNGAYMPFEEIVSIMRQIANALDFAHKNGVIHRDIKPGNIMIEGEGGRAVLMDFGLVMQAGTDNSTMGTAFGTPRYISPEQAISSQQAVPASDQYSLAVIIYEMLTNKTPFDDDSAMSLALSHITNPPPNPQDARPDLNDDTVTVILKSLEKTPEDRYKTVTEFIEALATAVGVANSSAVQVPAATASFQAPASVAAAVASHDRSDTPKDKGDANAKSAPEPQKRGRKPTADKAEVKPKEEKNNKKTPPPATNIPKKERVPMEKQADKNRQPIYLVGGLVLLIVLLLAGAAIFAGGDGDDNGDGHKNGANDGVSRQDDIILEYTNDYLVIYNQSDQTQNLVGLEFVAPDGSNRFNAQDFGVTQTLPNFVPKFCAHVYLNNNKLGPPSYCELDEDGELVNGKELGYNNQTGSPTKYWVWLQGGEYEEFNVVMNGDIIKTCPSKPGKCSFSLPN